MLGTKLLLLSVLAYASGQRVSYYGSSSVRNQSRLPPRPLSYRPSYAEEGPVYNPQPVYEAPTAQLTEQPVPEPTASLESQPPLRPPQPTYGLLIPIPPVHDPQGVSPTPEPTTEAPEIPPQSIYSPIPPHPAIPFQPSPRPISPRPAWSWRPSTTAVEIIEENPTTPSQIIYPDSASKTVEPSVDSSRQSLLIEEISSTSKPEAISTLSVSETSSVIEYHEQSEPFTDPIPEPSSEQPQPAVVSMYVSSPQPPSNIQAEDSPYQSYPAPRPLPTGPSTSPVPGISLEPQLIEPEPVKLTELKPIDPVPSVPSYQPIELQEPSDFSAPIQPSSPSSPPQTLPVTQYSAPSVRPETISSASSYQPIELQESSDFSAPIQPSTPSSPHQPLPVPQYSAPAVRPEVVPSAPSYQPIELQEPSDFSAPIQHSTPGSPPQPLPVPQYSAPSVRPEAMPSASSYQPIELQEPSDFSAPIQPITLSSSPHPLPVPQYSAPAVRPDYYQPPVPAPEPVRIPLSYQPIAPASVLQPKPSLAPRPSYQPIQPSQRPAYQPQVIQKPLPAAQPAYKPIQSQIPQQPLPEVQPATTPVAISQPQRPSYSSGPVPVPEALPVIPINDFHCNAGNAYYKVVNECDSYIVCQGQRAWKHTCPDGLHFNPNALFPAYPCSYPSEVKCEVTASKQIAQPTSECPNRYGFFPISGGDCSSYLMCQEGKASVMNCPFGLVFNNKLSSCDWPENVPQCSPSAFKGFSCPIPPEDDPDFLTRHRYGNDCGVYVACQHGHPRLLKCDFGLSFDEDSQVCIYTELVEHCNQNETRYQ